jgi:putative glycosyltransferase (TIGR04348 family)
MRIRIVTPAPAGSRKGNRVTARRWANLLRELGHRVTVEQSLSGGPCDCLIALHARHSLAAAERFRCSHPDRPLIVAATGTDIYQELPAGPEPLRALDLATRIVLLQPLAELTLPPRLRSRARVIFQSASAPPTAPDRLRSVFEVCVVGHLRPVKDPLRAAAASRLLPPASRIRITQVGGALTSEAARDAREEMAANPRYRWLGERPRSETLRVLARSRLMALTSLLEGGANVVSEALAAGVPVVSSRIPGSVGMLGEDYPGFFPVGDTPALAALLHRTETDPVFYEDLASRCRSLKPLVDPTRERTAWRDLLAEFEGT